MTAATSPPTTAAAISIRRGRRYAAHALELYDSAIDAGLRDRANVGRARRYSAPVQVRLIVNPLASGGRRPHRGRRDRPAGRRLPSWRLCAPSTPAMPRSWPRAAHRRGGGAGRRRHRQRGRERPAGRRRLLDAPRRRVVGASPASWGSPPEPLTAAPASSPARLPPGPAADARPGRAGRPPLHVRRLGRIRRRGHPAVDEARRDGAAYRRPSDLRVLVALLRGPARTASRCASG